MGRFLTGSPPILGLLAVDASLGVIEQAGMDALWSKSQALTKVLVDLVAERLVPLGAALATPLDPQRRGAHISVSHPQAWAWCSTLIERGLVVGDFRRPDVIRLGPAPLYTRFSDVFDAVGHMESVLAEGLPTAPAGGEEKRPRVT
jgi:kynureninase